MDSMKEQLSCKILGHLDLPELTIPDNKAVIVTTNSAFGDFIKKHAISWGYNEVNQDTPVLAKATKHDIKDKVVFGIIPNYLARYAISVVELEIVLPLKQRHRSRNKLSLAELEKYVDETNIHEYVITVLVGGTDPDEADNQTIK